MELRTDESGHAENEIQLSQKSSIDRAVARYFISCTPYSYQPYGDHGPHIPQSIAFCSAVIRSYEAAARLSAAASAA